MHKNQTFRHAVHGLELSVFYRMRLIKMYISIKGHFLDMRQIQIQHITNFWIAFDAIC